MCSAWHGGARSASPTLRALVDRYRHRRVQLHRRPHLVGYTVIAWSDGTNAPPSGGVPVDQDRLPLVGYATSGQAPIRGVCHQHARPPLRWGSRRSGQAPTCRVCHQWTGSHLWGMPPMDRLPFVGYATSTHGPPSGGVPVDQDRLPFVGYATNGQAPTCGYATNGQAPTCRVCHQWTGSHSWGMPPPSDWTGSHAWGMPPVPTRVRWFLSPHTSFCDLETIKECCIAQISSGHTVA